MCDSIYFNDQFGRILNKLIDQVVPNLPSVQMVLKRQLL
jgi:hypothetical protein